VRELLIRELVLYLKIVMSPPFTPYIYPLYLSSIRLDVTFIVSN